MLLLCLNLKILIFFLHFCYCSFSASSRSIYCYYHFFLLIIKLFSHSNGISINTFCPFTPGLTASISSFVSKSHSLFIWNVFGLIWFGIIISKLSPTFSLFFISIIYLPSSLPTIFPPNSYPSLYCFPLKSCMSLLFLSLK